MTGEDGHEFGEQCPHCGLERGTPELLCCDGAELPDALKPLARAADRRKHARWDDPSDPHFDTHKERYA